MSKKNTPTKVLFASLAGTTIEFFDFYIYANAAVLVFPSLFFHASDPSTEMLQSLATFSVAFFARPLGSAFFGHFGDRVGRKITLVAALLTMGISTVAIGLLPTYQSIGILAPILLIICRFGQGFGLGGEWGGAVLLAVENAPPEKKAWYGMFPQLGAPIGLVLSGGIFLYLSNTLSNEQFFDYGWRIPFLVSFVLVIISMYIQLRLEDTKAFKELEASKNSQDNTELEIKSSPILEALRRYPERISLAAGAFLSIQVTFYILVAFILAYGVETTDLSRNDLLTAVLIGSAIMVPAQFYFSHY